MYARVHLLARRGTGFLRAIPRALRTIATHDAFLQERRSSRLSGSVTMARSPAGVVGAQATRIEVILIVDAEQVGARLIEHSGSDDKSAHSFTQASWRSLPQITGESFQFFFVHKQRSAAAYSRQSRAPDEELRGFLTTTECYGPDVMTPPSFSHRAIKRLIVSAGSRKVGSRTV